MIWKRSNDLSRYYGLLVALVFFLAACGPAPTSIPSLTETVTPSITTMATATFTPSQTPTLTPTPEPAWYQLLDPSMGALKYNYALVNNPKARVYISLQDAAAKTGNFGYLLNYPAYVAYTTTETRGGRTFYFDPVNYGWMDGADLKVLTPSTFTGILLTREVTFRFGWVLADTQSINAAGTPIQAYSRYQIVQEVPAVTQNPGYIAIGADEWLPEDKVALVGSQVPVDAGANTCRFIYANLAEQTLTVYKDCKLVFATLISSGANSWTFEGRFAIQYKVEYSTITPPEWSTSEYYIQGVPYFITYAGNFGFHGAYWHDNFGTAASHGCINLSPADAKWLY
ncbi:MAG: L,D-transpeptidase, partial [Chloroflexi bacterium]|nr:L,D-transpeptidase [Chloroflexota bacterium]